MGVKSRGGSSPLIRILQDAPLAGNGSGAFCVCRCLSHRWPTELETSLGPALGHSPQGCGVIHHTKPGGQDASPAPRSSVRIGFLRSNSRFEAVLLRRWLGLIATGTAPPSPRGFDSTVAIGVKDDWPFTLWLVAPIREHGRRFWRINGLRRGTIDDVPSV